MTSYHAIRVDMENNAEDFWTDLRDAMPELAASLERNGCALVSYSIFARLDGLGAFNGEPSPLIDYGTSGEGYCDVIGGRHAVIAE